MTKPHIAVIGGGYSGMAAAVRITECGGESTVFEAARILGGRARRIDYLGRELDNGQHILSGAYVELLRLINLIGLADTVFKRIPLSLAMPPHFLLRAPRLPAPFHMAAALLTAKGLTWSDRFKAIHMMRRLQKLDFKIDSALTVAAMLRQFGQSANLIRYLWQPLTVSALNTPIESASAQVFANVLRDALAGKREASDLLLPTVNLTALFPAPAAIWVSQRGGRVNLGQRVLSVTEHEQQVILQIGDTHQSFDAVIIAVGPHQRDDLLPSAPLGNELTPSATALSYQPITTIYMGFDTPTALPSAMIGQTQGVVHWFFDRRQLFGSLATTELVVSAVISASGPHDLLDADTLAAKTLAELRQFAPTLPQPTWQKVIREKFATFACTPDAPRPSHLTASRRIFLAGDDVANPQRNYPATIEGTVRNGVAAADAALKIIHSEPGRRYA